MSDLPATPATQASNVSPSFPPSGASLRKERGAIAAQACDTCRSRKQRCDEQRPKCGTCQKFKLECNYREPQPTKKDKTLVEILDRIKNLEGKIDSLSLRGTFASPNTVHTPLQPTTLAPIATHSAAPGILGPPLPASAFHLHGVSSASGGGEDHYKYVSSVHQMLAWPAIQQLLASAQAKTPSFDLSAVERDRLGLQNRTSQGLPTTTTFTSLRQGSAVNVHTSAPAPAPITVASLNWDTMQRLSKAYFGSFNLLYPILDRHSFVSGIMPSVFNEGFSQSIASTIAFLVFALGEIALSGSDGLPLHAYNGRPSGVKGGSKDRPPGLDLFNEARRRMGFNLTECSLENVQIFALASMYYGTSFYPMVRLLCQNSGSLGLLRVAHGTLGSLENGNISILGMSGLDHEQPKRAIISKGRPDPASLLALFHHGNVIPPFLARNSILSTQPSNAACLASCLNLEFGFPLTGLEKMETIVGLPDFSGPFSDEDYISNQESHFQEYFASQIVLRRLLVGFHGAMGQGTAIPPSLTTILSPFGPSSTGTGINYLTIRQHALQFEQWRGMLPAQLRWQEESPGAFPNASSSTMYSPSIYSPSSTPISPSLPSSHARGGSNGGSGGGGGGPSAASPLMFTTDLDAVPMRYPYSLDIQVAVLRSRYYYAKYLVHRPFLYKALHFPDAMTHDDAVGAAECLKASLKWPIAMSPTCTRKRLVPCLFFFTQNLFGILVVLHLSTTVPILRRIRTTLCGESFEMDARETVGLYLDWLRDLKPVDAAAGWQWDVARSIYGMEE